MAKQPMHPWLPDHNARVRRWVKDFDDATLHPILLVLGYGVDLDDNTYKYNVVAIARGMARYRKGKVPDRATVFRQLAKLEALGIVKSDDQFGPTRRQKITHRIVDFRQAVRSGQPVGHLWDAPLPAGSGTRDAAPHATPDATPGATPDATPLLSSTVSELSQLALVLSSSDTKIANADEIPSGEEGEEEPTRYNNSYFLGISRKHPDGYFRPVEGAPRRGETRVDLSVDEARFMWVNLRNDDPTRAHKDRLAFLNNSASARAILMERTAQREAEARAEAERQDRERAEREEAERQERLRAEEERRAKVRQEINDLFEDYAMCWGDRGMDRAREIAHKQIDNRVSRGRVDEVLAEMKRTIAKNAEWIAEYKADPAQVMARLAKEEADREANRQAEAGKKARDAARVKILNDLQQQYRDLTGKHADVDPLKGYDAMVEQLTRQIEEHGPRP